MISHMQTDMSFLTTQDCFFAAVAARSNPQLVGQSIVIAHSSEDSTGVKNKTTTYKG